VPRRVSEILHARYPDRQLSVLDLGCGTGLTGIYLGPISGPLVGIDVSQKMLEQARKHGIYTSLRQNDLLAELRDTPAGAFDCITANDVFIYVGDLSEVIPAIFPVLRSGGMLIFSCETAGDEEGELVLRPSKRYAHSRASIERMCRAAGFVSCAIETIDLRLEKSGTIEGYIAVAEKA
jgi:predicted TPR repeat methyltransferase